MSVEQFNLKLKVHSVNGSLRITIPSSFHKQYNIQNGDEVAIVFHRLIKSNGCVNDFCKVLYN